MRILLLFLVVLVLIIPGASALSISETIANGSVSGFNLILRSITDQLFDLNSLNSTTAMTAMSNEMVKPNDFLSNPFVQNEKDVTAFWFVIFYIIFLLAGGIKLFNESASQSGLGLDASSWRNTYIMVAVIAPLIWAFYLIGFKWIFSLEFILSRSMFLELAEFLPLDSTNALAYLFLGVIMVINIVFFSVRYLVIGLVSGWFLFIVIAWFVPITKIYGKLLINYGLLMLFSRFVVVLIFLGGFGILQNMTALPKSQMYAPYFTVLALAVLFELACIMYPIIYVMAHSPIKYIKVRR